MANVGFSTMFIGLEAGNGQDLLLYNKHTTVQDNYNIMDIIRQHDIAPIIGFINLNPYSTKKTLAENFRFLLDIKCANLFQYAGSCISLQRYSPLYLKVANDGLLYDTYSYKNTMEYEYKDDDVRNIAHFIMQELRPRVLKLDMEVDSLWQYYIECKKVSCDVVVYEDRILSLKREYLGKIQEFLYPLFVEGDIETTRSHSERYFGYFEKKQIEMLEIYKELVLCFREATVYD